MGTAEVMGHPAEVRDYDDGTSKARAWIWEEDGLDVGLFALSEDGDDLDKALDRLARFEGATFELKPLKAPPEPTEILEDTGAEDTDAGDDGPRSRHDPIDTGP